MRGMATVLDEEDMAEVAAYLAGLSAPAVEVPATGDLKNGNNYYQSKCGACHGGKAEGNVALNAPALAFLDAAYLTRQSQKLPGLDCAVHMLKIVMAGRCR